MQAASSLLRVWRTRRPRRSTPQGSRALATSAVGATAFGAVSLGALSVGALAIGALAIGRLAIGKLSIRDLRVESLEVARRGHAGVVDRRSHHSVQETVERLQAMLRERGVTLFALVDHSGEAERVGMKMRPAKLLIFGSPKAGTPLMNASPRIALDLPLKLLVWEDADGTVRISHDSVEYLRERHHLPQALAQNLAMVSTLAEQAAD
jgi:uncharacterized protein (DUF302 family)